MRESEIEAYLVAQTKKHGGEVRKVKWIGRRNAPDRLVALPAKVVSTSDRQVYVPHVQAWVELKATGKQATQAQQREHTRMRNVGMLVLVMNSIEQIDSFFEVVTNG